ncbi:MAG TPA: hypothetical protein VN428_18285 [Bryobacteraceae bacterium]|nr:hypothetical protein [Bryobacteraceae bacterium]
MPRNAALTPEILNAALAGLEAQKARLNEQIADIRSMLGARGPGRPPKAADASPAPVAKKKRKMSAEGRARIIEGVRKRWAALRKAKASASGSETDTSVSRKSASKRAKRPGRKAVRKAAPKEEAPVQE